MTYKVLKRPNEYRNLTAISFGCPIMFNAVVNPKLPSVVTNLINNGRLLHVDNFTN